MRILFDLQALQNGSRSRGIGRYVRHLFSEMSARRDIELYGLLNASLDEHLDEEREFVSAALGPDRVMVWNSLSPTKLIDDDNHGRFGLSERIYEDFLQSIQFDVLLVGSLFEGFSDNTVTSLKGKGNYRRFVVLYDLIPLIYPEQFLGWDKIHSWYHDRLSHLESADGLFAISQSAGREAVDLLNIDARKVVSIGTATDPDVFNARVRRDPSVVAGLGINRRFVMHASALEARKNFEGLLKAYAGLPRQTRQQHQLVLVGRGDDAAREALVALSSELDLAPDEIIMPGHVDDAALVQLYRHCSLFVFPSFHEGFGLPALEAMSCGCPTIGSNRSSIPEVIGNDELLFDPDNIADISSAMQSVLGSPERSAEIAATGLKHSKTFRWSSIAAEAVKTMRAGRSKSASEYPSMEASLDRILAENSLPNFSAADARQLAKAVVSNERQSIRYAASPTGNKKKSWRIEGPFDSSYSLALLNRESARALDKLGYDVSLFSTEGPGDFDANPYYLGMHADLASFHEKSNGQRQSDCDVVSRILYPPRVIDMKGKVNALHHYAWEESGFPEQWAAEFNQSLTMMTCLSRHVEKIMIDNGVTVPLVTSGCGVDHWERIEPDQGFTISAKPFRFLHVSSCFPRKGAEMMLEAYGRAFGAQDDVSLIIKTFENPHNKISEYLKKLQRDKADFPHVELMTADLSDGQLKRLYELCDVLIGPSYGEGFGLPFAEAMLSGLPVITTKWGGQLDFCNAGNSWLVDYQFEWAETHFGVWSSAWAKADDASLESAIVEAFQTPKAKRDQMAARGRRQLLEGNRWIHVAQRLAAAANILPAKRRRTTPVKIGWISTWGSRCGIAGYSKHLTSRMELPVTIFAPKNEEHSIDDNNVVRGWSIGKDGCGFEQLAKQDVDVFVLQFNYNFYNHDEIRKFIRAAHSLGKKVIVTLHSTVDPPETTRAAQFFLEYIKDELALCDRLLVHSVHDMNRLKAMGLVENVALFPLGVLDPELPPVSRSPDTKRMKTVATYGFALPNKGLEEVVQAISILKKEGRSVRLLLNNAEYPAEASATVINELKGLAKKLELTDLVDHAHDYVSDDQSIERIREADLAIFAYQQTGESASAAVRFGLAAGVPVVVTPLPIFDDLRDAVFRLDGTSPRAIADGIAAALDHTERNSEAAVHIAIRAAQWRKQHAYPAVAKRLASLCMALAGR